MVKGGGEEENGACGLEESVSPSQSRDLNVKNLKYMNVALLSKLAWKVVKFAEIPWVEAVQVKYLPSSLFLKDPNPRLGLAFWNHI